MSTSSHLSLPEITASEQDLRDILDSIRQTIVLLSPNDVPRYANQSVLECTGSS